ncbi:MAG: SEC-C metal-binding domain-containing protein, partial [Candidatus Marinimicrobia bacterium]|nr:SEC-C metal-binding domain-containing protein [Candidatus Neomarinimicrobiota bacterium]
AIERGTKLLIAHKGLPKNKKLMKILQESGMQKLLHDTESRYMQDKKIDQIEEELYYSIDEKSNIIDISDKGREVLSPDDPNQFIIPDIGEEFAIIDEQSDLSHTEKEEKKNEIQRLHSKRSETIHNLQQLLRAHSLHEKDADYVVQNGKVMIVDEFTGRILPGRRYSEGLHQAIEAKENVKIAGENQTLATITLQNYFRMYDKLAGMTGTAITEADEFQEIYELEVVSIPTNRPCVRDDKEDMIYKTKREKYSAIIEEIAECHQKGQPVLVGTITVDVSETISRILKRARIPHNVLNAKQHQREAEVILRAGNIGGVTIATNMAGRGTDIKINDEVKKLGGLKIIGTERHESRRIDLQLRGRAGRQGDAGESEFFLSLEDDLMRLFGSERISSIMDRIGIADGEVISHSMISRSIEKAQKKVEERNFGIRKHLLEYDDVMNKQREVIYDRRNFALHGGNLQNEIDAMIEEYIDEVVLQFTDNPESQYWNWDALRQETISVLMTDIHHDEFEGKINPEILKAKLIEKAKETYKRKNEIIPAEMMRNLERWAYLQTVDKLWKEHLFELDQVKEGIGLQAYGQKDPLIAYKSEAFRLFKELLDKINHDALQLIFRTEIRMESESRKTENKNVSIEHAGSTNMGFQTEREDTQNNQASGKKAQPFVRKEKKIGRNDPCPCGSGKKYKNCCGK